MSDPSTIGQSPDLATTTGASFELELQELLLERCRLVFTLAFAISAVMAAAGLMLLPQQEVTSGLIAWVPVLRFVHPITFALALGALYVTKPSASALQMIALVVLVSNLVLAIFSLSIFRPDQPPFLGVALGVFIPAAFIPWQTRYQVITGVALVLAAVVAQVWAYSSVPGVLEYWAQRGGVRAFRGDLLFGTLGNAVIAVVGVIASHTLYSLRKTAHKAERMGNYMIRELLGKGGMGEVYRAQHAHIRRPTAVKVMRPSAEGGQAAMVRFEREVQLSSTLTHPNTITIYDFGRTVDNQFFYAMEYLDGLDLEQLVQRYGPLPPERVVHILIQACGALDEAHARGIIHRDIKPSNIYITQRGRLYDFVKVLDFGLAKQITDPKAVSVTKTGVVFGTPRYISPEAVQGAEVIDGRADIYCLGAVAYWLLTGRAPFDSGSAVELLIDHLKATPIAPSAVAETPIPEQLDAIVMKCLQKKPEERFQTAELLLEALEAVSFAEPWTQDRARDWWQIHGIASELPAAQDLPPTEEVAIQADISQFFFEAEQTGEAEA